MLDELRANAHDAITECLDRALSRGVAFALLVVHASVDFDDEPSRRATEVDDVSIDRMWTAAVRPR